MKDRFAGKVVVITGGGGGIGRAAAQGFAAEGAQVVILDSNATEGEAACSQIGSAATFCHVDITSEESVVAAFEKIRVIHGRVDCLFNNAGITRRTPTESISLSDWEAVLAVNMTGLLLAARSAVKLMPRNSSIVNTASLLGLIGGKKPTIAYQASKGAVISMTRAWAMEWASRDIRVNAIAPAFVRTPFTESLFKDEAFVNGILDATPLRRIAETSDITGPVLFLCSDDARMITGHILPIDGGVLSS